jgi:hypothetical protein
MSGASNLWTEPVASRGSGRARALPGQYPTLRGRGVMGRKRATLREGIGDAERQYAQALRDIRDHRVRRSRSSGGCWAGASPRSPGSRPPPSDPTGPRTSATSLSPRPRSCAGARRPPTRPCRQMAAHNIRRWSAGRQRSGTAAALDGPGVYRLLEATYPAYPLLRLFGDEAKPLPVWPTAGTAAVRPDSDGGHELGRRVRARSSAGMLRPMAQLSVSRPDRCCPWGTVRDRCYGHAEGTAGEDNPARA